MDNIPHYIARKHGEEEPDYLYPSLEPILKETFGIMIYQEQVMQIAQELAGYSLGAADLLRRAMGKKIKAEMDAQRESFVAGAVQRGVPERKASDIFDLVAKFAGYGFNKSHAAAYAMVAYQTAYLKANYPVELLAASMTFDMSNTDKLNVFRQELDRLGIEVLPPDINCSRVDFGVEAVGEGGERGIRYALAAIKNVGANAMSGLVAEREAHGKFRSLAELAQRVDSHLINKRTVENLASAGAFDELEESRQRIHRGAEMIVRHAQAAHQERESQQSNLFGGSDQLPQLVLPKIDDWPPMERLAQEFSAIGFYLSAHPLDSYNLERLRVVASADLVRAAQLEPGRKRVAGIVIGKRELTTRSGSRMAFVQLSDTSGVYEVTFFSEILTKARELMDGNQPLLLQVTVEQRGEGEEPRITVQDLEPLDQAVSNAAAGLKIYLRDRSPLNHVRSLLAREGRGRARVSLVLDLDNGREVEIELPEGYRLSAGVRQAVKALPGVVVQDT
jgi:DNA polymerase-3 subunit alpha